MLLSYLGTPVKEIPIRLNPGDIVLVSHDELLTITHTVHLSTRSKVSFSCFSRLLGFYFENQLVYDLVGSCGYGGKISWTIDAF
jgi:hypothetical protein